MRFRDRQWHARLWGLALLCAGPIGACEEDEPADSHEEDEEESSSSSGRSSWSRRQSTQKETVADCKDECEDVCVACKSDCDEDDEDCNKRCDDKRYTCRKACAAQDAGSKRDAGSTRDADVEVPDSGAPDAGDAGEEVEEPADGVAVTIKFEARVGKKTFACGEEYSGIGSQSTTITPTDLRMFVQDLKLVTAAGKEVAVELDVRKPWQGKGVALLDFEDGTGDCGEGNAETNMKITGKVPKGSYVGVSFSNGVPEKLNHADPTTAADPLGEFASLSWGWLGGYRFTKVDVREVAQGDTFGAAMAHIGSTACSGNPQSGTVKCGKPNRNLVELDDFDPKSSVIVFDVGALFEATDLTAMAECHSTGEFCEPMFEAFGVDLKTGKALTKQTVFSVE
ncbi:MAG TPA: MbnP family copper-binding protein [Polyangiales bacterium]|nr:MbnP family copper-binding protein [Polyangiales bacterium]